MDSIRVFVFGIIWILQTKAFAEMKMSTEDDWNTNNESKGKKT